MTFKSWFLYRMCKDGIQYLVCVILITICCLSIVSMHRRFDFNTDANITNIQANGQDRKFQNGHVITSGVNSTTTYLLKKKIQFLKNYRNPCWRELDQKRNESQIRCLPYFYLVGAPKCGTTDLFVRLRKHPLISSKVKKELHWLTRKRFGKGWSRYISYYLHYFYDAVERDIEAKEQNNYHPMIFGDGSVSALWDIRRMFSSLKYSNITAPPYSNADIVHNLYPGAKILIILRNPITRLYSEYLYFRKSDKSVEQFHDEVVSSINAHINCSETHTPSYCAYFLEAPLRVQIGFYHIYIEDYYRVFRREQVKVLKLEDYSKHIAESMIEVFTFLGIGKPSKEVMANLSGLKRTQTRKEADRKLGDMFPKTWQLLADFYKPYNERLVKLLGNKFRYN